VIAEKIATLIGFNASKG